MKNDGPSYLFLTLGKKPKSKKDNLGRGSQGRKKDTICTHRREDNPRSLPWAKLKEARSSRVP